MPERASILISCLKEEAEQIRERARQDRRSVSSYVLRTVMQCVDFEEKLFVKIPGFHELNRSLARLPVLPRGPRTAMHLHCSSEDSRRIRMVAKRREMPISVFIRQCLRRSWSVSDARQRHPLHLDFDGESDVNPGATRRRSVEVKPIR